MNDMTQQPPTDPMGGASITPYQPDMMGKNPDHTGVIQKGYDETNASRIALVKKWTDRIKHAKAHFKNQFKQMEDDMSFVSGHQWETRDMSRSKYVANITQRHIAQSVAALYAKNPTVVVARREKLDFAVWDESRSALTQLMSTMQGIQGGMQPQNPQQMEVLRQAQSLYQDVLQGVNDRKMLDKIARTMQVLFKYTLQRQNPVFKLGMKQLVRRVCITSVGYIKLGLQRVLEQRPEDRDKVTDITQRIDQMQRLLDEMHEKGADCCDQEYEMEQLRLEMQATQQAQDVVTEEGIVFDFPRSTSIIVDPKCINLRTFWGAQWVAQEYVLSSDDIMEIYKRDVGDTYNAVTVGDAPRDGDLKSFEKSEDRAHMKMLVWEIYDKTSGLVYVVCDGFKDFLKEPVEPEVKIRRFWPFFPLMFNEVENEKDIYPQSDVSLIRPMQKEFNRAREGLREHRHANRPLMVFGKGAFSEQDIKHLENHDASACIPLLNLQVGQKITDLIQPLEGPRIDPAMYETQSMFDDITHVAGSQEANLGGTGDSTATESSIAESSRISALQSNIDDLDDTFNEVVDAMGEVMLKEYSLQTVQKICGRGAVWPVLTAQEVADQLNFTIEAGSSGRPNKALEIANFEKIAPILLQIPGVSPDWMAKQAIMRLDDRLDVTEALTDSMQSIIAMNSMQQTATGNPATDPTQQGQQAGTPGANMPKHGLAGKPTNPNTPPPEVPNGVPGPGQHGAPHPTPSSVPQMPNG